jgi:hypothetical protein
MVGLSRRPHADVGHLLDQHRGVLPGQLREGAVGAAGTAGQVAGAADLVGFLAALHVALLGQRLLELAFHLGPLVVLGLDAGGLGGLPRVGGQRQRACESRRHGDRDDVLHGEVLRA